MNEKIWDPLSVLSGKPDPFALIVLNTPLDPLMSRLHPLWSRAVFKAVTDGAASSLYQISQKEGSVLLPDFISGDFDSAAPEILDHYKREGVKIIETPDQNATDFTKCIQIVLDKIKQNKLEVSSIFVFGSFSGRLDHILGNLHTLHIIHESSDLPVYLYSGDALACIFGQGCHRFLTDSGLEGSWCGLIPVGCPAEVTTTGLKWNLDNQKMEFGGLISTSNQLDGSPAVTVRTDHPLVWTMGVLPGTDK